MSDAFIYMFVVGSGAASGVAVVGMATYYVFRLLQQKSGRKEVRKKRGVV